MLNTNNTLTVDSVIKCQELSSKHLYIHYPIVVIHWLWVFINCLPLSVQSKPCTTVKLMFPDADLRGQESGLWSQTALG